jgi:gluconate 2-dehydrogenase alpha chain
MVSAARACKGPLHVRGAIWQELHSRRHDDPGLGITYDELEPCYDRFERTAAVSGKAGNIRGQIQPGGNFFESPRSAEYPLPPLTTILSSELFAEAASKNGYHPFPRPTANASRAYTNPDGSKYGACQYCGYCGRFGCEANAKGSAHITVIPIAMRNFGCAPMPGSPR